MNNSIFTKILSIVQYTMLISIIVAISLLVFAPKEWTYIIIIGVILLELNLLFMYVFLRKNIRTNDNINNKKK